MPMPSIPVGFAQVKFEFTVTGVTRAMCTTLGIGRPSSGGDALVAHDLANDMAAHWAKFFPAPSTTNAYRFNGCTAAVQEMADSQDVAHSDASIFVAGGLGQKSPPINSAILVEKHTSKGGKRYRGRMYLPPCYITANATGSAGEIDGAEFAATQIKLNNFFEAVVEGDGTKPYQPVLLHNQKEGGEVSYIPTEITALVLDRQLATQRKRMR